VKKPRRLTVQYLELGLGQVNATKVDLTELVPYVWHGEGMEKAHTTLKATLYMQAPEHLQRHSCMTTIATDNLIDPSIV
jgi:hypothetical protein